MSEAEGKGTPCHTDTWSISDRREHDLAFRLPCGTSDCCRQEAPWSSITTVGTASAGAAVDVSSQLRRSYTASGLYDLLFGLEYLSPQYSLTFNSQQISQLSPGERGLLLLVFYLLVDKDSIPLVIDQPEENLDNQTIFHILVKCIRSAKQRRQIVMVTHNPNLAVVCDAEQIVGAACDKAAKRFAYRSGAIEDGAINTSVVEVLEGTQPAFVNRKTKYGL